MTKKDLRSVRRTTEPGSPHRVQRIGQNGGARKALGRREAAGMYGIYGKNGKYIWNEK